MSDDDLNVIDPASAGVEFGGALLKIKPLKVGQLPAFARAIKPISGSIEAIATGRASLDVGSILAIIGEHGESVVEAVSIASGISIDTLNEATPDQLVELAVGVLKINADFFKGRLTPAILAAFKQAAPGAGLTP